MRRGSGPEPVLMSAPTSSVRVLLVEDYDDARERYRDYLEFAGFLVDTARDGHEALRQARKHMPDLILMDLSRPGLDGWEATRILKGASETRAIPIMAMTAHAIAGDQERALQAGCDDYHAKPVEFQRLLTQIEALLKKAP